MNLQTGDILMFDSNKFGPRCVKFLMTAPTVWQHIWRAIRHTQEIVRYYHLAMVYGVGFGDIDFKAEQQWKVQLSHLHPLPNKGLFIARFKRITATNRLMEEVNKDIGKNWDILNVLGKTLTWLTGIKWFARYVQWPGQEICVNRVAEWYYRVFGYLFGVRTFEELTTHQMYKWIKSHPEDWEIILES